LPFCISSTIHQNPKNHGSTTHFCHPVLASFFIHNPIFAQENPGNLDNPENQRSIPVAKGDNI